MPPRPRPRPRTRPPPYFQKFQKNVSKSLKPKPKKNPNKKRSSLLLYIMEDYIIMKKFHSREHLADTYYFSNGKSDEVGSVWFMTPLQVQLKRFVNGLGRITYYKTISRDLETTPYDERFEKPENQKPFLYEMVTDYVLFIDSTHNVDCDCNQCEEKDRAQLLKVDGFDDCYLGVGDSYGEHPALVYDYNKIIKKLQQDGMSQEEAEEYYDFNIIGSYIGEKMPIFLNSIPLEDLGET